MFHKIFTSGLYYKLCCFVLFAIAAAASFNGYYQEKHFSEAGVSGDWYQASFESMVDGTAYRPYVYRQMLPSAANWLDRVVPESVKTGLYDRQGKYPEAYINAIAASPIAASKVYFFRYLVIYIATYTFALLAVMSMYLVCVAVEIPQSAAVLAPVVVILFFPYIQNGGGYYYDYPELTFLALTIWIALKFDWWWIIPVAALGTWNKESYLLIVPTLYPIFRLRNSRLGALLGVGVLSLVWLAVYYPIRICFQHNPGSTVLLSLPDQLQLLLHTRALLIYTKTIYGVPMITGYTVAPVALLLWTVWRGWNHLPGAIQQHGIIAAAINIPVYLLFVAPGKLRDLSMLYVVFLLMIAVNLKEWMSNKSRQIPSV